MEVTITPENFESYKNGSLPLVVDLWATWCGPCRMLAPIVSELASEYDGKIVVGKCDVEENEDIAMEFGVRNIPTLLFFKNAFVLDFINDCHQLFFCYRWYVITVIADNHLFQQLQYFDKRCQHQNNDVQRFLCDFDKFFSIGCCKCFRQNFAENNQ